MRSAWVAYMVWWRACRAIAVDWCAPCELSAGGVTFNFFPVESHYSMPCEVGEFVHATSERASWMSNLRSFLRLAVSRFLALVPLRDYGSLTGGMVDDPMWRHALYSLVHRQSGPSLLCAGQWSKTYGIACCTFGRRWNLPEMQRTSCIACGTCGRTSSIRYS